MSEAAADLRFEYAARLRDEIKHLRANCAISAVEAAARRVGLASRRGLRENLRSRLESARTADHNG